MLLSLALDPILPMRAPGPGERALTLGYRLRLQDGPSLLIDDPLLLAFGACTVALHADDEELLQHEAFTPGRELVPRPEPDSHDEVAIWDAEEIRRPGTLTTSYEHAARAALDHGLPLRAVALQELRDVVDESRVGLRVLLFSPAFVTIAPASPLPARPARPPRPRLVLLADGTADVRWWDPSGAAGPLRAEEVPVSEELAERLAALRRGFAQLHDAPPERSNPFSRGLRMRELEAEAIQLWRRARSELGRDFVVGFMGPGMNAPRWDPRIPADDDPCPF